MITIYISKIERASPIVDSAIYWCKMLDMNLFVLLNEEQNGALNQFEKLLAQRKIANNYYELGEKIECATHDSLKVSLERLESAFVIYQLTSDNRKSISEALSVCRELRMPYLLLKSNFNRAIKAKSLLIPITYLTEDRGKGQFALAFARHFEAKISIIIAKDYGTRAKNNAKSITQLLDNHSINYNVEMAKTDSYSLEKSCLLLATDRDNDMIILSASREYGLDDLIFGSKELKLIKRSKVPILLLNPRSDIYVLCD